MQSKLPITELFNGARMLSEIASRFEKAVDLCLPSGGEEAVRRFYRLALTVFGFPVILAAALGQRSVAFTDRPTATDTNNPELAQRQETPSEAVSVEGLIRLDATVTDQTGNAIAGLQRSDFKLLDNGRPQQIIAFRASTNSSTNPDDSLSVILLLDTLEVPPKLAAFERQQATQFLQQNSGKLAQPVTICTLEDSGFFLTSKPSTDGNALARDIASDTKVKAYFLAPHVHSQFNADIEPSLSLYPALAGLRALWTIATGETSRPGRKLLFWIGPNLGISGTGAFEPNGNGLVSSSPDREPFGRSTSGKKGEGEKRDLFQKICRFSLLMRQARVTLDCFSLGKEQPETEIWPKFLTPVPSAQEASWMNLFKNVLAMQSGGRIFPSSSGLVEPMNDSVENARIFYSFTFDPPLADHGDEYHTL